jgi:hypothetical protein
MIRFIFLNSHFSLVLLPETSPAEGAQSCRVGGRAGALQQVHHPLPNAHPVIIVASARIVECHAKVK